MLREKHCLLEKSTATEHATSSSSTATEHATSSSSTATEHATVVDTVGTRGGRNDALEPGSPPVVPFDFIEGAAPNEIQTHTQVRRLLAHLD